MPVALCKPPQPPARTSRHPCLHPAAAPAPAKHRKAAPQSFYNTPLGLNKDTIHSNAGLGQPVGTLFYPVHETTHSKRSVSVNKSKWLYIRS